jgi:hypothetical protein
MNGKHSNDKKTINCSTNEQNFDHKSNRIEINRKLIKPKVGPKVREQKMIQLLIERKIQNSLNAKFDERLKDKKLCLNPSESKKGIKSPNKIYFTDYAKQRLKVSFISYIFRYNLENILILSIS